MFPHDNIPVNGESAFLLARWVFLRALGLVALIAFLSFWVQARGLIGRHGILPVEEYLAGVRALTGPERFWRWPTLFWLGAGDGALHLVCALGVLASLALLAGFAPLPSLFAVWALYLSIFVAGQDFLSFQWDILLVETLFAALFLAPATLLPGLGRETAVPVAARWLMWWLLFRLMFESGVVKFSYGDPTWWNLTALDYHYFTQPLPTWIGWYAHGLPHAFQKASEAIACSIEIVLPLFLFAWRPLRLTACAGFVFLNLLIGLTGNYNFFNLLAIVLSLFLLDDAIWCRVLPVRLLETVGYAGAPAAPVPAWQVAAACAFAAYCLVVGSVQVLQALRPDRRTLARVERRLNVLAPLHAVNGYGLFRVMTTQRPEIIVEGSADGHIWKPYEFRYKPGDLRRRPAFVEPHQPRLDWQMWFAALGSFEGEPWFQNFLLRLLENRPEVTRLLASNPFPEGPRFVRAQLYSYRFTTPAERRATGDWWAREPVGAYSPAFQRAVRNAPE